MTTMKQLRAAVRKVERELKRLELWIPAMSDTQVYLVPIHYWYGWTCLETGNIYIPRVIIGCRPWTLLDVLRHEYGHVFTCHHPEIMETWPTDGERVSKYADEDIGEDFAETFKYFVKHKGKLPKKWQQRPGIVERWKKLRRPG
ncbi:MAG: hypothetical protein IH600_04250 [Bacteroidetes bacterium]|nr:hypothetical protein [Bacteroidota bacterium]